MDAIASHDMTPVRLSGDRRSSCAPLEPVWQTMQTCQGTIVIAMARKHVVERSRSSHPLGLILKDTPRWGSARGVARAMLLVRAG
jgi:hypothetical protein